MKTQTQIELGITPKTKRRYRRKPQLFPTLEAARSVFDRLSPGTHTLSRVGLGYAIQKMQVL